MLEKGMGCENVLHREGIKGDFRGIKVTLGMKFSPCLSGTAVRAAGGKTPKVGEENLPL